MVSMALMRISMRSKALPLPMVFIMSSCMLCMAVCCALTALA